MILCFKIIYEMGINPELTKKGNKIYEMKCPRTPLNAGATFRDSWNLLGMPLGRLVAAFDLDCDEKMFFPHLCGF